MHEPDFAARLHGFWRRDKYHGLMVDFEDFPEKAQPGYRALLDELSSDLHARGMKLYVSVPPHNEDFDYAAVSAAADGVVVMNYDENTPDREAGPVASQEWFTRNLGLAQKAIPRDKLICAIGNYGYDWAQKPKHGSLPPDVKNVNVSVQEAWLAARDSEEDVDFDSDALNPHVSYLDEKNIRHDIWFLDAVHRAQSDARRPNGRNQDVCIVAARVGGPFAVAGVGRSGRGKCAGQVARRASWAGCGHGGARRDSPDRSASYRW